MEFFAAQYYLSEEIQTKRKISAKRLHKKLNFLKALAIDADYLKKEGKDSWDDSYYSKTKDWWRQRYPDSSDALVLGTSEVSDYMLSGEYIYC